MRPIRLAISTLFCIAAGLTSTHAGQGKILVTTADQSVKGWVVEFANGLKLEENRGEESVDALFPAGQRIKLDRTWLSIRDKTIILTSDRRGNYDSPVREIVFRQTADDFAGATVMYLAPIGYHYYRSEVEIGMDGSMAPGEGNPMDGTRIQKRQDGSLVMQSGVIYYPPLPLQWVVNDPPSP